LLLLELRSLLSGWLRESFPITLFYPSHGPEQMVIRTCSKLLRLAVERLHHQRIENANLLQCRHIAMDASERCVEAVEKIVDVGFRCAARRFGCTAKICVSHNVAFLVKVILWLGTVRADNTGESRLFFV
jgi:hypothetical protein